MRETKRNDEMAKWMTVETIKSIVSVREYYYDDDERMSTRLQRIIVGDIIVRLYNKIWL